MATIDDVAALARVSTKTVSRVMNGEPHVRPELESRVREAVDKLGYLPNHSARRLAGGRSSLIAFLYNNPSPSYIDGIQSGAAQRCRELGYHLIVEPFGLTGFERMAELKRLKATVRPDGVFLVPPLSDDLDLLAELRKLSLPTLRIAATKEGYGSRLITQEKEAGRVVTEHLLTLGHQRIAVIGPPARHMAAQDRVAGYLEAMKAAKAPVNKRWIREGRFDFKSGLECAEHLLSGANPPTAIFAANDEMALGAIVAARKLGLSVPEGLSVVGFDDTPASTSSWPALTTVRQPLALMGRFAVNQLARVQHDASKQLQFSLIVRGSTSSPKKP